MISDDVALLREYAQSNSEQAFAALVSRHVNLVYSVAIRQVRNPHLAEEITQGVFIILARKAKSLSPKTILSGWLCRTARNIAANTLRTERRRQFHEQDSQMQSLLNEPDSTAWNQIAPLLDEALNCLGEKEHDAVVLRFFEGQDLKQVGGSLGMREDAARMRVNRGLEKLREFFTKRGVTLSAAAIAGAVSANSVQAAPVGLAATITATALSGTTITTATVIVASKAIAMTILQKTVIAATVAVLAGAGIYEAYEAAQLREQNQTLQQQQAGQIQQLQLERDEMAQKLATLTEQNQLLNSNATELLRLRGELAGIRSAANSGEKSRSAEVAMKSWLNRVKEFKRLPIRLPDKTIPELQLLTEEDWLELAKEPLEHNPNEINLEDDSTARLVLSSVRVRAKQKLTGMMVRALNKYVEANDGLLPTDTLQLKPYFVKTFFIEPGHVGEVIDASVDDAILQRYGILQTGKLEAVSSDALIIAENAPVDTQFDTRVEIGRGWMAVEDEVGAYSNNLGARASNEPTNK